MVYRDQPFQFQETYTMKAVELTLDMAPDRARNELDDFEYSFRLGRSKIANDK